MFADEAKRPALFVISGNIATGKSTLAQNLYGFRILKESTHDRPYLEKFYRSPRQWAFQNAFDFLLAKIEQLRAASDSEGTIVQDRGAVECITVFGAAFTRMGWLSLVDHERLEALLYLLQELVSPVEGVIFLKAPSPILLARIRARSRNFEAKINLDYLDLLGNLYERWVNSLDSVCRVLEIDTSLLPLDTPRGALAVSRRVERFIQGHASLGEK